MADRVLEVEGLNAWYMVKKTPFSPKEKKVVLHRSELLYRRK